MRGWEQSLTDAIAAEAEIIALDAGVELLEPRFQTHRDPLREQVIAEMTAALSGRGDGYQAPDGVRYSVALAPPG